MINYNAVEKVRDYMREFKIDGMYFSNYKNISYILNINVQEELYITFEEIFLLSNSLYITDRRAQLVNIKILNLSKKEDYIFLQNLLKDRTIGIESRYMNVYEYNIFKDIYKNTNIVPISEMIELIRVIKSDEEINKIKKASEITLQAFEHIVQYIKPYQTEIDIKNELETYMFRSGANGLAFETIVASGPNTSKPHSIPSERQIQENDIILLDFGASYEGYCTDMTRTIFIGNVSEDIKEKYNIVLEAQKKVLDCINQYVNIQDIDRMVRTYFLQNKLEDKFVHSLGHGIGIEAHEVPSINGRGEYILKKNMVLAIEPGIYFENEYGIRIEDTIVVKEDGIEVLTNCNKEIITI